jgi:hypothetical protein
VGGGAGAGCAADVWTAPACLPACLPPAAVTTRPRIIPHSLPSLRAPPPPCPFPRRRGAAPGPPGGAAGQDGRSAGGSGGGAGAAAAAGAGAARGAGVQAAAQAGGAGAGAVPQARARRAAGPGTGWRSAWGLPAAAASCCCCCQPGRLLPPAVNHHQLPQLVHGSLCTRACASSSSTPRHPTPPRPQAKVEEERRAAAVAREAAKGLQRALSEQLQAARLQEVQQLHSRIASRLRCAPAAPFHPPDHLPATLLPPSCALATATPTHAWPASDTPPSLVPSLRAERRRSGGGSTTSSSASAPRWGRTGTGTRRCRRARPPARTSGAPSAGEACRRWCAAAAAAVLRCLGPCIHPCTVPRPSHQRTEAGGAVPSHSHLPLCSTPWQVPQQPGPADAALAQQRWHAQVAGRQRRAAHLGGRRWRRRLWPQPRAIRGARGAGRPGRAGGGPVAGQVGCALLLLPPAWGPLECSPAAAEPAPEQECRSGASRACSCWLVREAGAWQPVQCACQAPSCKSCLLPSAAQVHHAAHEPQGPPARDEAPRRGAPVPPGGGAPPAA